MLLNGILKMMGAFTEMKRNMISERVKSGMINLRAKEKIIIRLSTAAKNYLVIIEGQLNKSELARLYDIK